MKTAARYKAVWELMTAVFADRQPADNIINAYFRERRFIGSGDRRFIAEKIWHIIRRRRRLTFEAGSADPRKLLIAYLKDEDPAEIFAGGEYGLPPLNDDERKLAAALRTEERTYPPAVECECPDWLFAKIGDPLLLKALNEPAGADFRVCRGSREEVLRLLENEGFEAVPTPYSPLGIRLPTRINLNNCMAYQDGLIEVQDEASQLAALMCGIRPEDRIIDYCSGAGGKALALAAQLKGQGVIEAHDINPQRLEQLKPRLARLCIGNVKIVPSAEEKPVYTRFIIDAPCSGTGTWRRAPDAKFRLTPARLEELNRIQAEILEKAYALTASSGRIVYITCSVLEEENGGIVRHFLERHPDMSTIDMPALWREKTAQPWPCGKKPWLELNPLVTGTDGFFVAVIEKH